MPNLYDHSEPGCLFTVLFGTLPLVSTYLSFVQKINPSFDVFNIFIVIRWHTVQEFVRDLSFFLCVCVWGGGGVNFEGGTEKSRFDKGGNKVWPKYSKGGKELRIRPGGIRFLIIWMYNKVLNGQSKPCLHNLLSEQHHAKQLLVSYTFFLFVPDSLLIKHLKLSCGIHSFSLNLNVDFLEIILL